jgi:hypothetical protein
MKAPLKSTLIIVVTLLIGIAIGFQISEMTLKSQFRKMSEFRQPQGFLNFFEEVIKPGPEQKKIIEPIILKYHNITDSVARSSFKKFGSLLDSMQVELKPNLTGEQNKNLAKRLSEMRNMGKKDGEPGPRHNLLIKVDSTKEGKKTEVYIDRGKIPEE